eukprot:s1495_g17.t1
MEFGYTAHLPCPVFTASCLCKLAEFQLTTAVQQRVGDLHACKVKSASADYGSTAKSWRPPGYKLAALQLTTTACKLTSASADYGSFAESWWPACYKRAALQLITTVVQRRVGDLHHARNVKSASADYGSTAKSW